MRIGSKEDFHKAIHGHIGSPTVKYVTIRHFKKTNRRKVNKVHAGDWAESSVNLSTKNISVRVYIDFQKNSLSTKDYSYLKNLASKGISNYWSRKINLSGEIFNVSVTAHHRHSQSIDVDLYIEPGKDYARSHNSGIIDASFIHNIGFFRGSKALADRDFMLVSAHEFGHSVLEYFGDADLSWTHKGSTNKYLQNTKPTTPGYPSTGEIDLMKYYDRKKNAVSATSLHSRTLADEVDVMRLVWMSKVTFLP